MKTPREVLLGQHQAAEPKLDAIRQKVVAGLTPDAAVRAKRMPPAAPRRASALEAGWRQIWWSLRWHLAGLSAAWLVVLALSIGSTPAPAAGVARRDAPSPQQLLAALRENQRQLRELIATPAAEPAPEPRKPAPSPQSQIQPLSPARAGIFHTREVGAPVSKPAYGALTRHPYPLLASGHVKPVWKPALRSVGNLSEYEISRLA